jgi:hypothetical protein
MAILCCQPSKTISIGISLLQYRRQLYLAILCVYAWQVDLSYEDDLWWSVGVVVAANYPQAIDTVLVDALLVVFSSCIWRKAAKGGLTWGGPRMVPVQLVMRRSSPSSRPYEHASEACQLDCPYQEPHIIHTCTQALLALLKLLQQPEVAGYFGTHNGL